MITFVRFMFALLGVFALLFSWQFAISLSQHLAAGKVSLLFFTSLIFSVSSIVAGMIAFYGMKHTPKLKPKQRLVYVIAYVLVMLPSVATLVALNQQVDSTQTQPARIAQQHAAQ